MTSIVSSTYTVGPAQADGRCYVTEQHTDSNGAAYEYMYLIAPDPAVQSATLNARAAVLNAQLAAQDAAAALVAGTLLPISKYQFRQLFSDAERQAADAFNSSYTTNSALTAAQIAQIRSGLEDFNAASVIEKPFKTAVTSMLTLYVAVGILTQARADAITAAGSTT